MINKLWDSADAALADIGDGAVVGIGGFGGAACRRISSMR